MKVIIYNLPTQDDFVCHWANFISKFGLEDNEWLTSPTRNENDGCFVS